MGLLACGEVEVVLEGGQGEDTAYDGQLATRTWRVRRVTLPTLQTRISNELSREESESYSHSRVISEEEASNARDSAYIVSAECAAEGHDASLQHRPTG